MEALGQGCPLLVDIDFTETGINNTALSLFVNGARHLRVCAELQHVLFFHLSAI
jgi:hypothetical protein